MTGPYFLTFRSSNSAAAGVHAARWSTLTRPPFMGLCDKGKSSKYRVGVQEWGTAQEAQEAVTCRQCQTALVYRSYELDYEEGTDHGTQRPAGSSKDRSNEATRGEGDRDRHDPRATDPGVHPGRDAPDRTAGQGGRIPGDQPTEEHDGRTVPARPAEQQELTLDDTIQAQFLDFHHKHPSVYTGLVRLAVLAKTAGRDRIGIGMLFEVLRWEWTIEGLPSEDDQWKLNNNYRSRYARLIMNQQPELASMFKVRKLQTP